MKLSRWAYERMQTLRLPVAWRDIVEKDLMNARALPMIDSEDLQPTCYRCGQPSPLTPVEGKGDTCSTCGGRFYRSFLTFQHLPLIEFRPAPGITSEEALALLDESPPPDAVRPPQQRRGPGGADVLSIGGYGAGGGGRANYGAGVPDPFDKIANGRPAVLDRVQLKALPRSEVLVRAWPGGVLPTEFFHLRHTDVPVVVDGSGHFYEQDEFESFVLTKMEDPFCRISASAVRFFLRCDAQGRGGGGEAETGRGALVMRECGRNALCPLLCVVGMGGLNVRVFLRADIAPVRAARVRSPLAVA